MWKRRRDELRQRVLTELLDAHGDRLYGTLVKLTRDRAAVGDLFQELFVRLGRSSQFARANNPPAYAFRTAIHLAMEWRRKQKRNRLPVDEQEGVAKEPSFDPSPLRRMIEAEDCERLLNALSDLPRRAREVFVWRFFEDESYEAIAKRLGKTPHQVRGLCHSAVRKLRRLLGPIKDRTRQKSETGEST
jgi:RNA polymerase sigma factor (sigma-70 family)